MPNDPSIGHLFRHMRATPHPKICKCPAMPLVITLRETTNGRAAKRQCAPVVDGLVLPLYYTRLAGLLTSPRPVENPGTFRVSRPSPALDAVPINLLYALSEQI